MKAWSIFRCSVSGTGASFGYVPISHSCENLVGRYCWAGIAEGTLVPGCKFNCSTEQIRPAYDATPCPQYLGSVNNVIHYLVENEVTILCSFNSSDLSAS